MSRRDEPSRFRNPSTSGSRQSGFTLIELLVALTLTVLLLAVVGQVAVSSHQSREHATRVTEQWEREALIFDTINRDLAALIVAPIPEQPQFQVIGLPRSSITLYAVAPSPTPTSSLHLPMLPAKVRYSTQRLRDSMQLELLREVTDLSDPAQGMHRETLAKNLTRFEVTVFDGRAWQVDFPRNDTRLPAKALRVICQWKDDERPITKTYRVPSIQAGG